MKLPLKMRTLSFQNTTFDHSCILKKSIQNYPWNETHPLIWILERGNLLNLESHHQTAMSFLHWSVLNSNIHGVVKHPVRIEHPRCGNAVHALSALHCSTKSSAHAQMWTQNRIHTGHIVTAHVNKRYTAEPTQQLNYSVSGTSSICFS